MLRRGCLGPPSPWARSGDDRLERDLSSCKLPLGIPRPVLSLAHLGSATDVTRNHGEPPGLRTGPSDPLHVTRHPSPEAAWPEAPLLSPAALAPSPTVARGRAPSPSAPRKSPLAGACGGCQDVPILDHLSIQCADVGKSASFYDAVCVPLGAGRVMDFGEVIGFGVGPKPEFWIGPRPAGKGSGSHT